MEDLGKGAVGQECLVAKEEVLESQGKLCMNLVVEGLSFQVAGCQLCTVVDNTIATGPHSMGDGQQLFNKSSLPGLDTMA